MSQPEQLPAAPPRSTAQRLSRDDLPRIGQWFWIKVKKEREEGKSEIYGDELACVEHVASNHIVLGNYNNTYGSSWKIGFLEFFETARPEPGWRHILQNQMEEVQAQLRVAVASLADKVAAAGLMLTDEAAPGPATLLPSTTRSSPEEHKVRLLHLRDKALPEAKKQIKYLTEKLVALQKNFYLGEQSLFEKIGKAVTKTNDRLFALELYAGLQEKIVTLRQGAAAPVETPVTIRQMLRYMDEECLFDLDQGGMDFEKLEDFDAWVAQPVNRDRLIPEPRCVVAFQIRREDKDYSPSTCFGWFMSFHKNEANKWTYLLIRNGDNLYRVISDADFKPRLLPFRTEFNQPFIHTERHYSWKLSKDVVTEEVITPENFAYDEHVEKRSDTMLQYNRILFLVQGLLDRSEVFKPHPPINLGDPDHIEQYVQLIYDEEDGLPSAHPPVWEDYRNAANARLRKGHWVYAAWEEEVFESWRNAGERYHTAKRNGIFLVTQIKKDRSQVRVSWPWGTRYGRERPGNPWNKGDWGEWEVDKMRHAWVPMKQVFNVTDYKLGDYKQFFCDAYLKGAYLDWAPQLLGAEKWYRDKKPKKGKKTTS